MPSSADIDRKLRTFSSVGDIVSAMKAYAGMTVRRTEDLVPNIREYESTVVAAMGDAARLMSGGMPGRARGGGRLLIAFGSSQGLCGAYNDHVASRVSKEIKDDDTLFVIGARLKGSLESLGAPIDADIDSPASISGIPKALENTIARIVDIYRGRDIYHLSLVFTVIRERQAEVGHEQVLPPCIGQVKGASSGLPPMVYMDAQSIFEAVLEEFLYISLYRACLESLRSENWYRLNVLEGATDRLGRHLTELRTLKNYVRQEEITEEMLEILQSGGFYG
jgi:F-type H+-transporting ATPase subunit gamma